MFAFAYSDLWQPYVYSDDSLLIFDAWIGPFMFDGQSTDSLVDPGYSTGILDIAYNEMETAISAPVEESMDEFEQFQRLSNAYTPHVEVVMSTSVLKKLLIPR